ncbi:MAG: hypothetical protein JW984_14395 [Deltaproteobacteria bacterium]|uniref:Uncharacterized protein n=1 Tax=Candidatus Zymogenus saltonus TaxID=2844893 RepID=A0A9D8KGL9_9DELT|nr:hypothetical protein [Candidatus Zymogenus saltonus]
MRRFKISTAILLSVLVVSAIAFSTTASAEEVEAVKVITHFDEEKGLVSNNIFGLMAEASGKGWGLFIASVGGLHVYVDDVFLSIFQGRAAVVLNADYSTTEEGDPTETLWTYAAGEKLEDNLLYRVSSESGLWTAERLTSPREEVTALSARHRTLYIGTDSSLYYIEESELKGALNVEYRKILTGVSINTVVSMGDGTLALGMREEGSGASGLKIIGGEISGVTGWVDRLSGVDVTALLTTEDGLLIGTESSGIYLLGEGGEVRNITTSSPTGKINEILLDNGRLCVAADGGLFVGDLTTLTRCGLTGFDGSVTALAPGPGSLFWVGTKSNGLYLVEYLGAKK